MAECYFLDASSQYITREWQVYIYLPATCELAVDKQDSLQYNTSD